jgi:hypothetical protein
MEWHWTWLRQTAIKPVPSHAQLVAILHSLAASRLIQTDLGLNAKLDRHQMVTQAIDNADLLAALEDDADLKRYLKHLRWDKESTG